MKTHIREITKNLYIQEARKRKERMDYIITKQEVSSWQAELLRRYYIRKDKL